MLADAELPGAMSQAWTRVLVDSKRLTKYRDYHAGKQMLPRIPVDADPTLRELVPRSTINLMRLAVNIPAQLSFIDGFFRVGADDVDNDPPEWRIWDKSGFNSQQTNVFRASLKYGHSFVMVDPVTGLLRLLPTRNTVAFFADPVNDRVPIYAVTIRETGKGKRELLYMDDARIITVPFDETVTVFTSDILTADGVTVDFHRLGQCPVVRFTCELDDEGNATGVVEPLIPAQDRVNQSTYDLLVTQTYGSFKVRWAAGLTGEPYLDAKGEPVRDQDGFLKYKPLSISQSRFLMTDDPNAKFGTLDSTPLDGFISALDNAIRSFAVMANIPPHSLLGAMSNLSAETIAAAMGQTNRFTHMLKMSWGESVLKLMELVRLAHGLPIDPDSQYEVRWRDMADVSMAQVADALGKAATMLGVPGEGLWSRLPGATDADLKRWRNLKAEQDEAAMFENMTAVDAASRESRALDVFGGVSGTVTGDTGSTAGA